MKRTVAWILLLAGAGALLWWMPLVRIVSLDERQSNHAQVAFSAAEFAKTLWPRILTSAAEHADDASVVLTAAGEDPQAARTNFGRSVGLGRSTHFFLRGTGTIVSVNNAGVGIALERTTGPPDVVLETGLLFGNAVRDSTGLVRPSDFPNSQDYNQLSNELNRLAETLVLPALKEHAQVGRRIEFVGCGEVKSDADWKPLQLTPLEVRAE